MLRRFLIICVLGLFFFFNKPVYSKEFSNQSLEKYINKISNKFSRTYCNTTQFGISSEGALAFAIGETNKEFKRNKLNEFIDYSLLKNNILNNLQNNCQIYEFPIDRLDKLKFD